MAQLEQRIHALLDSDAAATLAGIRRGIEKESLRITTDGTLAQTPHPPALGSALTHPYITTDYSEALLEFITPPSTELHKPLEFLEQLHRYVYSHIGDEVLWVNSMPCMIRNDDDVPVAQYGSSNVGRMKSVYREGLGHRYGRKMQTIAGIHYNFSYPEEFWKLNQVLEGENGPLQDYISRRYFDLTRNFQRYSWLLVYLFGASPALCKSFLAGREHQLDTFDHTLFKPNATSLRMSDLGYQNNAQSSLAISYNNLDEYVATLTHAIKTPEPAYDKIGVKVGDDYRQLNANILQIENEYYSSIRPKRTINKGERPTTALQQRGVEYIEIRALDLNPFEPVGINQQEIRFLDLFATYCLLRESPQLEKCDLHASKENLRKVVYEGRNTATELCNWGKSVSLKDWASEKLTQMQPIAELFDRTHGGTNYSDALARQQEKVDNPDTTPSARILDKLESRQQSFFQFAMDQALAHRDHFLSRQRCDETNQRLEQLAEHSLTEQRHWEDAETQSFEDYLADYFRD
ncbi:MAG: glutamate--cysteine ligase [Alcanivorax sp.]|jgi:glutamate--cysteine ligase|uniref:glutamate--cysteine ligase n=1 Tax=Alcanivorax jadensis TaxID=64988 RepID=UPI000C456CA2|nr:glutamate--cysteine ligase [Alcanivorax jadensis]MBG31510.1 glutamate--cysteine ligase [Alcanivorax sp.]MBL4569654.1 glutamate--cysteine ligase [Alcanivorax sp.]MDF1636993.1 glutamate--cysteine ligase [Alcanivorax jadensis]|tara:strand:- start:4 stop:1563 length:1560 start_codon:yes stop_codon:yes gene_type:complete